MSANYLDLISFGVYGIEVANYNKVRATLVERFKDIYGSDIDLSSTSADGQWIEQQSLLINNMLQVIKQAYSNLDPREASGEFLDIIASYTNVVRRPATKSTVYVSITGLETREYTLIEPLVLLDKNGDTWTCSPFSAVENEIHVVLATSDKFGPVRAPIGWIYTTVEQLPNVEIIMNSNAITGQARETDSQLRARRNNSLSMKGVTVLESIISNLLNVVGIEDVIIYNNDTGTNLTAKDGTTIAPNSIYVSVRKNQNIPIDNSIIGSIIYEKKTPGIATTQMKVENEDVNGFNKDYNYPNNLLIDQFVYWKEAKPLNPTVEITLTPRNYFVSGDGEGSTGMIVGEAAIKHLNNIGVSQDINHIALLSEVLYADSLYRGMSTYTIESIKIDNVETTFVNPDTYFNYTTIAITTSGTVKIELT